MPLPCTERRLRWGLAILTLAAALILGLWPGIDLAVSARFYAGGRFPLETDALGQGVRLGVWRLSIAVFGAVLACLALTLAGRPIARAPARLWAILSALFLLGPGLMADGLLKAHWGRARPADVSEFGGRLVFTPFWQPSDQCLRNCSFVSGEVAGATALAIALLLAGPWLWRRWPRGLRALWLAVAALLPVLIAAQRIATGRHFLSDAVFAALFVAAIALVLLALFPLPRPGRVDTPPDSPYTART